MDQIALPGLPPVSSAYYEYYAERVHSLWPVIGWLVAVGLLLTIIGRILIGCTWCASEVGYLVSMVGGGLIGVAVAGHTVALMLLKQLSLGETNFNWRIFIGYLCLDILRLLFVFGAVALVGSMILEAFRSHRATAQPALTENKE